ncbi:MAG: long-chain-fatty-acid--CoA ligase [Rhodospirillales bacterium]|nr:long-chain-fatty-acid--CoA ligase [Rhodospirillales bacterium]
MHGLMMRAQLTVNSLIEHAAKFHGDTEIVSRTVEGPIHRTTYGEAFHRVHKLAGVLAGLGVGNGDRVATLAWNGYRHLELYFAISGMGAVCHTINPRLFPDQITFIVGHAADKVIFVDLTFVPVLEAIAGGLSGVNAIVIMTDNDHMPETSLPNALCFEDLMAGASEGFDWPEIDENTASSLCYSSGTTGNPKGVLYSHRSTVLHSFAACSHDGLALSAADSILPVVPMFHVNAWGIPYGAAMAGAKLVLPGAGMDGGSVWELLDNERVTLAAGVPTIWMLLLQYLKESGKSLPHLERTIIGGSALPQSMIETFEETYDVAAIHAWGMTEMSPLGTTAHLKGKMQDLPDVEKMAYKVKQGRPVYGVDIKIVDDDYQSLPHDGVAFGELCVKGPWIVGDYYEDADASEQAKTDDGWFRTGDVCTIDAEGFMLIVDRSKDVIKSGGEWISSIELENIAVGHDAVAEAAVIGAPHAKWGERPLLVCVLNNGASVSGDDLIQFYDGKIPKWSWPDAVEFVDELPHTATGKIQKLKLRETYSDYKFASE